MKHDDEWLSNNEDSVMYEGSRVSCAYEPYSEVLAVAYAEHMAEPLLARILALETANKKLAAGVDAVRLLMDESAGVYGLHLNGDVAPWRSLESGGHFESWLMAFNDAEAVVGEQAG